MSRPSLRAGFAARVAERAEAERRERFALAPFERLVIAALAIAFAAAMLVAAAMADILPLLGGIVRAARGAGGTGWLAVLVLCVAVAVLPLSRTKRERGALHY
jgi:amino acid transporter